MNSRNQSARTERSTAVSRSTGLSGDQARASASFARARSIRASVALAASCLAVAGGCSPSEQEINQFLHDWETPVSASEYRVQPPDVLEISCAQSPEIDGEEQPLRQDGKISLRLLGEVEVAGLTPMEASRKLESLLSKYYVDPRVSVRVTDYRSKRFFVFGQVSRPGSYLYTGRDTLLNVLSQAQPTFLAWRSQVKLIRPSHDDSKRHVMTVDAERIVQQGKLEQNVMLQENDIVYVPPTPFAWIGLRMREIVWPVSPIMGAAETPADVAVRSADVLDDRSYHRSR